MELGAHSTIHSIPKILRTKHSLIKIIWIITTGFSVCFCSFLIYKAISDYLSYDVVTSIKVQKETKSEFPAVTFCNWEAMRSDWINEEYKKFLLSYGMPYEELLGRHLNEQSAFYNQFLNFAKVNFTDEQKKTFTFPFREFLRDCLYSSVNECKEADFKWYYDYFLGNCYRFNDGHNSQDIKYSTSPGPTDGLIIEILINPYKNNINNNPFNYAKSELDFNLFRNSIIVLILN
jgi:hypothetical protein